MSLNSVSVDVVCLDVQPQHVFDVCEDLKLKTKSSTAIVPVCNLKSPKYDKKIWFKILNLNLEKTKLPSW